METADFLTHPAVCHRRRSPRGDFPPDAATAPRVRRRRRRQTGLGSGPANGSPRRRLPPLVAAAAARPRGDDGLRVLPAGGPRRRVGHGRGRPARGGAGRNGGRGDGRRRRLRSAIGGVCRGPRGAPDNDTEDEQRPLSEGRRRPRLGAPPRETGVTASSAAYETDGTGGGAPQQLRGGGGSDRLSQPAASAILVKYETGDCRQ